jgi:hypothetical protein
MDNIKMVQKTTKLEKGKIVQKDHFSIKKHTKSAGIVTSRDKMCRTSFTKAPVTVYRVIKIQHYMALTVFTREMRLKTNLKQFQFLEC